MHCRTKTMTTVLLGGMLTLGTAAGCASHTTKTKQTVAVVETSPAVDTDDTRPQPAAKSIATTTTTTTENDKRSPGIIGSAFGLVWAVISFPFRVIGDLF
ncbi:MAG: hypothetical protein HY270_21465 [Deltaproteobacteria bacterium]|nr:hypothetical protein [Deltaproteobacteria bacterium]